jgi:hypothetical protein
VKEGIGREMAGQFGLRFHFLVNRRVLLHAANLRHGTDGFTSPPKEGRVRTRDLGYQRPARLTTRPPKPPNGCLGLLSSVRQPEPEPNQSPPFKTKIRNEWSHSSMTAGNGQ